MLVQRYTTDHDIAAANRRKGCAFHALAFALQGDGGGTGRVLLAARPLLAAFSGIGFVVVRVVAGVAAETEVGLNTTAGLLTLAVVTQIFSGESLGGEVQLAMVDQHWRYILICAFRYFPGCVGDHAAFHEGVFGGDLAVGAVGDQQGGLFAGDGSFGVALGKVDAAATALRLADAVGACADADVDAFAAVFAGVGVLQAFNGQVAGGDVGGIGHHNGAAQGQVVAGAAEVADVEAGVDVLGGFAAAVYFVVADAGVPAAGAAAAGANTG